MGWWPFRSRIPSPTNNGDTGLAIKFSPWTNDTEQTMFATLQIKMVGPMSEVEAVKNAFQRVMAGRV